MGVQTFDDSVGSKRKSDSLQNSNLVIPPLTVVDKIPTKQRIIELLQEREISINELGNAIGIGRHTIGQMLTLNGKQKRDIYGFELAKILDVLGLSYERFIQSDVVATTKFFQESMKMRNYEIALGHAKQMYAVACGNSEQCRTLNDLGRVFYYLKEYDKAHDCWLEAQICAEQIYEKFGDEEKLYKVLRNLLTSYDTRKEYSYAFDIINKVGKVFSGDPERIGVICYHTATIANSSGDKKKYREKMYEALEHFLKTNNPQSIGKAQHNIGHIEYQAENYTTSKEYYEMALTTLENEVEEKVITVKDLVKTLLCMNMKDEAADLLERFIPFARKNGLYDLHAKLLILLASAKDDIEHAISALSIEKANNVTKLIACQYILNFYTNINDCESLLRYSKIEQSLTGDWTVYKKGEL